MKPAIDKLLREQGGLKAREIAKNLGLARSSVSAFLHASADEYEQDDEYRWWLPSTPNAEVVLPSGWVTAKDFEQALLKASPIGRVSTLSLRFEKGCRLMFDCIARVLAVANQAVGQGCEATLDFSDCGDVKNFLNRAGFFDHLDANVAVLPKRPRGSAAQKYRGGSATLVGSSGGSRTQVHEITQQARDFAHGYWEQLSPQRQAE